MLRTARVIVLVLSVLYTLSYGLWRILLLTPLYEQFWQLQLSEVLGSWFYLPLLPLFIIVASLRDHRAAGVLLVPALFFLGEYGGQLLPNWPWRWLTDEPAAAIRVMTWNTSFSSDREDEFQNLVSELHPDLIALQELNYRFERTLSEELVGQYPYQKIYAPGSAASLAVLSRHPILDELVDTKLLGCRCQQVTIDLAGRTITAINTHIWSPEVVVDRYRRVPRVRSFDDRHQTLLFDALVQRVRARPGPLIVLGDLNTTERQPNFARLRRDLHDAFASAGWGMGYTFPTNVRYRRLPLPPFVRIDHILYSDAWQAQAAWTGQLAASDHRYVVADLALKRETGADRR